MEENKFGHLMVDIETMGTESYSPILSIAAVEFNLETGATGKVFEKHITLSSNMQMGLNPDPDTLMWWLGQSEDARQGLINAEKMTLNGALMMFQKFCNTLEPDFEIWGNSARFDLGLLQNAYNRALNPIPWNFRKERCVRTLVSFRPDKKVFKGVLHDALGDCYNQIKYCSETWNMLQQTTV